MPKKRKQKYSGALAQPIHPPVIDGLLVQLPDALYERYVVGSWLDKMRLLLEHYGVRHDDPERWQKLAFYLAMDHVAGIQISEKRSRRRRGAPTKRDREHNTEFLDLIEQIARDRKRGILDAIRIARHRKLVSGGVPGLQRRYYELKKRFQLLRDLLKNREPVVVHKLTDVYDLSSLPKPTVKKAKAEMPLRFKLVGRDRFSITPEELENLISLRKFDDTFYRSEFARITRR